VFDRGEYALEFSESTARNAATRLLEPRPLDEIAPTSVRLVTVERPEIGEADILSSGS
jgi:hypothetical protein